MSSKIFAYLMLDLRHPRFCTKRGRTHYFFKSLLLTSLKHHQLFFFHLHE
jgi:hypothetical protein